MLKAYLSKDIRWKAGRCVTGYLPDEETDPVAYHGLIMLPAGNPRDVE